MIFIDNSWVINPFAVIIRLSRFAFFFLSFFRLPNNFFYDPIINKTRRHSMIHYAPRSVVRDKIRIWFLCFDTINEIFFSAVTNYFVRKSASHAWPFTTRFEFKLKPTLKETQKNRMVFLFRVCFAWKVEWTGNEATSRVEYKRNVSCWACSIGQVF